jgi:micrococcal nuclease
VSRQRGFAVVGLLALVLLAGCGGLLGTTGGDGDRTVGVTVVEVIDGDTVDVRYGNGSVERVRLLGVDTPEVHVEVDPAEYEGIADTATARECLRAAGTNASEAMRDRLAGAEITLALDPESDTRGGYGRLLGYLRQDGENVNRWLLETGHARLFDSRFGERESFAAAEATAREENQGLWRCR